MARTVLTKRTLPTGAAASAARLSGHDQLDDAFALDHGFHQARDIVQKTGQRNANFFVAKESIYLAKQSNGCLRSFFKRSFEAVTGIGVADA